MKRPQALDKLTVKTTHILLTNTVGKFRVRYQLVNQQGTVISADDVKEDWLIYIAACVNATPDINATGSDAAQVMRLVIPGEHLTNRDSRQIETLPDGRLGLTKTKAYAKKLRSILSQKHTIISDERNLPIGYPVSVKCMFYVKDNRRSFVLPEMVATMLDILVKMNVLDNAKTDIVRDTNGSRIVETSGDCTTVVYIYRVGRD